MGMGVERDWERLTALVVDANNFLRGITLDQLRLLNFGRAFGAASARDAWDLVVNTDPHIVLLEWGDDGEDTLGFIRRLRTDPLAPNRAVNIFVLSSHSALANVEAARMAGVDGYLCKPITGLALKQRVRTAIVAPQPFVATDGYVGPCRRRRADQDYAGPWRRLDDEVEAATGDGEEDDFNPDVQLARGYVAALEARVRALTPGDMHSVRRVFQALQHLARVAEQVRDEDLALAAREMTRYLRIFGTGAAVEPEVLRTHAAAITRLVYVPRAHATERRRVALSLKRMIEGRLRKAGRTV